LGSASGELLPFAAGLQRDFRAVTVGLTMAISNAQTEGQVTRLDLVKRQRFGRAEFSLPRRCALLA
jgi:transposase